MEELDHYLNGNMDAETRRRFEERLSRDPDIHAEWQVREGLNELRLRKKVEAVADTRNKWLRGRMWQRIFTAGCFAGLLGLAIFVLMKNEPKQPAPAVPPLQERPADDSTLPTDQAPNKPQAPEKETKPPSANAIAELQPSNELPDPFYPAPDIRGGNSENKAWKALLDQLWYTEYPPAGWLPGEVFSQADQFLKARDFAKAYIRLQRLEQRLPANDTLRFLKGYCLMEMGEGAEAATYFEKLEERQPDWAPLLQWYRGLCLLLTGERQKAAIQFRQIVIAANHPYSLQGKKAIEILSASQ